MTKENGIRLKDLRKKDKMEKDHREAVREKSTRNLVESEVRLRIFEPRPFTHTYW